MSQLHADNDLLASWMSHYIAQLIKGAEQATPDAKSAAQEACAKAILELWQYRASWPEHHRPFAELDPILRTLASLDPGQPAYRYHSHVLREVENANLDGESKKWLELALGIDFVARLLIATALRSAALQATATADPWVELASQAGADEGIEKRIVTFVRRGVDQNEDPDDAVRRNTLSKLEAFVEFATSVTKDLRDELGEEQGEQE